MNRPKSEKIVRRATLAVAALSLAFLAMTTPACGGGSSAVGAGRGLSLLSFKQSGVDNVVLNARLQFDFSQALDPASINSATLQIREGPSFGATVPGIFIVEGSTVYFEPQLAGLCDQSDSGLKPATTYRVQAIGFPEEFAIRNFAGQALSDTQTYEFQTREDTDPNKYADQIPGAAPYVTAMSPDDRSQGVTIGDGNRVIFQISENLNPCSVNDETILFSMYESGDPDVFATTPAPFNTRSGFSDDGTNTGDTSDQAPETPYTWGAGGTITTYAPQKILADIELVQGFDSTQIIVTPTAGVFPENALLVVEVTAGVRDFGNEFMVPVSCAFTTENLESVDGTYDVLNEGETPWDPGLSTADINTARSPGLVQGYMLFAGDGDNGFEQLTPAFPAGVVCEFRANDSTKDHFDPTSDVLLDTGSSVNECENETDGSTAVVWEFASMHIRNGFTVRVVGKNPAIFLVQGDVVIENGGTFQARGTSTSDNGNGQNGGNYQGSNGQGLSDRQGGKGVAGGGHGGIAEEADQNHRFGDDGNAGYGSPDYDPAMPRKSPNTSGVPDAPHGAGSTGQSSGPSSSSPWDGSSAGGGGGGHAEPGEDGETNDTGSNYKLKLVKRSFGGEAYEADGNSGDMLQTPEAGSGGGGAGFQNGRTFSNSTSYVATGGAGGAGGGFIDITSSGNIDIYGTLDVAGGRGGNGAGWSTYNRSAGGGGGSGGGLRLLTPNDITLAPTANVTAAGGAAGAGVAPSTSPQNQNDGGAGGNGRIVMETSNGIVSGLSGAAVVPGEGAAGFFRGLFNANRFQGGGLEPQAVSQLFACGAFNPFFKDPGQSDFVAGVPVGTSLGTGKTAMLIEMQGYNMLPDATPAPGGTGWFTVGHFVDSGVDTQPTWTLGQPSGAQLPSGLPDDNAGSGIVNVDGSEFIQLRITIYLPNTIGPFDPGPYLDTWTIRFTSDQ